LGGNQLIGNKRATLKLTLDQSTTRTVRCYRKIK